MDTVRSNNSRSNLCDDELDLCYENLEERRIVGPRVHGVQVTVSKTVPECYRNPTLYSLNCEIWVRLTGLYDANYVVILDGIGVHPNSLLPSVGISNKVHRLRYHSGPRQLKKPMLVRVGEVSENPQRGREMGMGPIVGLHPLNSVYDGRTKPVQPLTVVPIGKLGGIIDDDEG